MTKYFVYEMKKECNNRFFIAAGFGNEITAVILKNVGFPTKEEAEEYIASGNLPKLCFLVTQNTNMTDGNGHMFPKELYKEAEDAYNYIMSQGGIYGTEQYKIIREGVNIYGNGYAFVDFNGSGIEPMVLK